MLEVISLVAKISQPKISSLIHKNLCMTFNQYGILPVMLSSQKATMESSDFV